MLIKAFLVETKTLSILSEKRLRQDVTACHDRCFYIPALYIALITNCMHYVRDTHCYALIVTSVLCIY